MSRKGSGPQGWSLFPSLQTTVGDMNIHNHSDRHRPSDECAPSKASSSIREDHESRGTAMRDLPLHEPSYPASSRRPSIDKLNSQAQRHYINSKPLGHLPQSTRAESPALSPTRSSPPRVERQERQERQQLRDSGPIMNSSLQSPATTYASRSDSPESFETNATSLPALQQKGLGDHDHLEPLLEEDLDPGSFDLVAPPEAGLKQYSLETRSELLFSTEHLKIIFDDPSLLLRFTSFLSQNRPSSIPILIYYLDAVKALKALLYSNAVAEALEPIRGFDFTLTTAKQSSNSDLEDKARLAFDALVREDLPSYITHTYIQAVSLSIQRRITGTLPPRLQESSEGLAEVFCLTDPSRPDNPIVFASEEFHRTTQYGISYAIGRNCRFLQGPKTNPFSTRRLREKIEAGQEHCEVFLNYRRDGSPFMNLLMIAPLKDSRGAIRYFIGAQVDVSGLVKESSDMESLARLAVKADHEQSEEANIPLDPCSENNSAVKDEFQELSEMLNLQELDTVRRWGGRMHKESHQEETQDSNFKNGNWNKPRLLINSISPDGFRDVSRGSGKLSGIYENYLLVRPYPSLRVLFASPSLRVPGILQSPFMKKIGGSNRVREELTQALADGRGVTARVRWISKTDMEGYNRWIHCTPLLGHNGAIGVWMIVIVDEESQTSTGKRFKQAPPVDPKFGRGIPFTNSKENDSLKDFGLPSRPGTANSNRGSYRGSREAHMGLNGGSERSGSPYTLRID